jgi:hypothetical protein
MRSMPKKKTKENQHNEKQRMIQWMVSGHGWLDTRTNTEYINTHTSSYSMYYMYSLYNITLCNFIAI